jgi:hypothetical protein
MAKTDNIPAAVDAWESGKFGREEAFAVTADVADENALDEALGLKLISIRLPVKLIDNLKFVANYHGVGYQPLIRDNLSRFALSEMKLILKALEEDEEKRKKLVTQVLPQYTRDRKKGQPLCVAALIK